jgi:hypothetical protein
LRLAIGWAVALAAALSLPGAAAWYSYGSNEPDNHFDANDRLMWTDAAGATTDRIYFNVFSGLNGGVSPNSATLGSRLSTGEDGFEAFYGVWRDCNHDGYVGLADGALREYRDTVSTSAGFPVDTQLCPVVADTPANQGQIFNSNGWITEMQPIGSSTLTHGAINTDHRTIWDKYASVWGDVGTPDLAGMARGLGSTGCTSLLGSNQDIKHTGGMLNHADCIDGAPANAARDTLVGLVPQLSAIPEPSSLYNGGPADQPTPQQFSGSDNSSNSYVTGVADCSAPGPLVDTSSVTTTPNSGEGKSGVWPPGKNPGVNQNGDIRGTVNYTHEISPLDDCNPNDDSGRDFDNAMGIQGGVDIIARDGSVDTTTVYKSTPDMLLTFRPWNNRQGTASGGCGSGATGALCGTPADAGLPEAYTYQNTGDNMWTTKSTQIAMPVVGPGDGIGGPSVDATKGTFSAGSFYPAEWYSFYASSTLTGYSLPGGSGTYGSDVCTGGIGRNAPNLNGWECDPNLWWLKSGTTQHDDNYSDSGGHFWGTVGDTYVLRDVDCYDGHLVNGNANLEGTSLNPTGQDVGIHTAPVVTDPNAQCA